MQKYPEVRFSSMHPGWADTPAVQSSIPSTIRFSIFMNLLPVLFFVIQKYPEVHFSSMHPGWADTPAVQSSMPGKLSILYFCY
jgi:hypothetical protein